MFIVRDDSFLMEKWFSLTLFTGLAKSSTFWFFWPAFGDVNLDKIAIFCCLNCIYECISGFIMLKIPWSL